MPILISGLLIIAVIFSIVSAIGVHRLKDAYSRIHATSTTSTLGIICIILASIAYFANTSATLSARQILTVIFLFITVPAGTHMLSSAALARGVRVWKPKAKMTEEEEAIVQALSSKAAPEQQLDEETEPQS